MPAVFEMQQTLSLTNIVAPFFCAPAQLGIFHKKAIPSQFKIDWLHSKYCTSEWGSNAEFLRLEGYTPGKQFLLGATVILTATQYAFFFFFPLLKFSGMKVPSFDTTPKGYIALVPSFWSVPNWKAAIFMHHDHQLLEQLFFHKVRKNHQTFSALISFGHFLAVEGFCAT